MASLPDQYPIVAVLKVDIKKWNTPVCAQYQINSVPYAMLFDTEGKLLGEGDQAFGQLARIIK